MIGIGSLTPGSRLLTGKKSKQIKDRLKFSRAPPAWSSGQSNRLAADVTIELPGVPQGKGRPRFSRRGFAYTPTKTRRYERELAGVAQQAMGGAELLYGPLKVTATAHFPVPASWSRKRRDAALAGTIRPTGRPDWDNLVKVTDALNGIVWKDDSQVVEGSISKRYSESPRLVIEVSRLDPPLLSGDPPNDSQPNPESD